jgi:hypothetical protein
MLGGSYVLIIEGIINDVLRLLLFEAEILARTRISQRGYLDVFGVCFL